MSSLDEAREQALRDYFNGDGIGHALDRIHIGKWMWDARGQYDEQRIAALVKWAEDILNTGDIGLVLYERGEALLSALGQPEEVER